MDTSKIIKGVVNSGRYTVTAPIVKEDYGLYLQIDGVELPQTYEVDFSNSEHSGTSVTMIGNSDGVLIPHQFISTGKDVFAFLYHVGEDFGRTVYKFRIPNKVRPDRTEEQPTPEEQSVIDQAISALNTAVAQTAQDVIDADASAQSASADADRASANANFAHGYAEQAEQSAQNAHASALQASASATASAQSASQSAQIKADVEELVDDAQASADASERSASNAYTYATSAERSSVNASASAQSASGYASSAGGYAQTASTKASEASGYASTASAKATESAQSASQALTYKTDAESAKTSAQTAQGLAESARDSAISAKNDAEDARDEAQSIVDEISAKADQIDQNTADIASLEEDIFKPYAVDTASGAIASFSDGADDIPLKSLVVNIDPVQDTSSGDPSPENICPISGWTGCEVDATGYNVWDEEWESGGLSYGNKVYNTSRIRSKNYIVCKPNTIYYFDKGANNGNMWVSFYDINKNYINVASSGNGVNLNHVYTTPDNCHYMKFFLSAQTEYQHNVTINYPSTDHDYHPYVGQTIPISWQTEAGTVYGGKVDVLSGVMRVDRATDDMGNLIWNAQGSEGRCYSTSKRDTIKKGTSAGGYDNAFAEIYSASNAPSMVSLKDSQMSVDNGGNIQLYDKRFVGMKGAQIKAELQGVTMCYKLAEPIEIQLTPHEVNSLLGVNNIFADTGDCSVEYRADTKLYIERLTAPDSADMIADANITSGQYFMVGNTLYKATANIANGGQIIVGTNCTRVSLAQALNEINA